jgi:hypothetical protein
MHLHPRPLLSPYLISKSSSLTGEKHTFLLWMREEQWREIAPFLNPELKANRRRIEEILPDHSPEEHQFLISGTTSAERGNRLRETIKANLSATDKPSLSA